MRGRASLDCRSMKFSIVEGVVNDDEYCFAPCFT